MVSGKATLEIPTPHSLNIFTNAEQEFYIQLSQQERFGIIKLTPKGAEIRNIVENLYQKHVRTVEQVGGINADEFATLNKSLHRLERFWTDQILYRL